MSVSEHIVCEEQFIHLLLNERDCVRKWLTTNLNIKYFDVTHELLLRAITWSFNEGVQLTRSSYKGFIEDYLKIPSEVAGQLAIYQRCAIRITKADDFPILIQKIKQSYVRRKSAEYFRDYNKDRSSVDDIEANRRLTIKLQSLEAESVESAASFIDISDNVSQFMKELQDRRVNPRSRLICNIPEIDETMGVGFQKGTLTLFCAGPASFKTTIMMNVGLNIYEHSNENVLFMPLEMPWEMMQQKIISRQTKIPFDKIDRAEKLTDAEIKQIAEKMEEMNAKNCRFKLLKLGERAKVSSIRYEIEKRINYYQPRVLVVDYLDNLVPETARSRNDLELRDIFEDLIKMGENYGFSVVTAAKLTRDALKRLREMKDDKRELDSTDIHGGQEFGGNAAFIYGQIRNGAQPGSLLDFFCMKSRFANPLFLGGKSRTTLKIQPEIGLIESERNMTGLNIDGNDFAFQEALSEPTPAEQEDGSPW